MLWKGLAFGTVMAAMFHSCSTGSELARGKRCSCRGKRRSHLEASKAKQMRCYSAVVGSSMAGQHSEQRAALQT